MSYSSLTDKYLPTPQHSGRRSNRITGITIHHMAGNLTIETCSAVFQPPREASSNYGIGSDGRIGCYVDEENHAWTSSNWSNDDRCITIEVADSQVGEPWPVSDAAYKSLIALCADICNRYGINPHYTGTSSGTLTEHRMFAPTGCPGTTLHNLHVSGKLERDIKAAMGGNVPSGGQWIKKGDRWWYKHADGSYPAGKWEKIDGKWYCFDDDGWMRTGWIEWKGDWYYCADGDSGRMLTGWQTLKDSKGTWKFYFWSNGKMQGEGTTTIDGKLYRFDKDGHLLGEKKDREVWMYPANMTDSQLWSHINNPDGTITLVNKACGLALDVKGGSKAKGTTVQLYPKNGSDAQKWKLEQLGKPYSPPAVAPFKIVSKLNPELCLDVVGGSKEPEAKLQTYTTNGTNAQRWVIVDQGNKYWAIINVGSGMFLDAKNGGK